MIDWIIIGIILVLVALAGGYVYRAKKNGKKQAFRLSLEERERVEFSTQPIPASELARRMNEVVSTQDCKKISYRQITDWLVEVGMLKLVENVAGKSWESRWTTG